MTFCLIGAACAAVFSSKLHDRALPNGANRE
jgi:hypothetical protein